MLSSDCVSSRYKRDKKQNHIANIIDKFERFFNILYV